jgi:hypothetical protein
MRLPNMIPTAIVLNMLGKYIIERRKPFVFKLVQRKAAKRKPITTFKAQVEIAYTSEFRRPILREGSVKKILKLSRPVNFQSESVQIVRLKKKERKVGARKKMTYTIAAGMKNL